MNTRHNTIFTFIALVTMLIPAVSSASTISAPTNFLAVNTGLVGWWTFDGARMIPRVIDSSGTGNDGRLIGQTSTTTVLGRFGQALKFDGTNDYVNAGSNASLQLTTAGSISVWVKYAPQPDFSVIAGNMDFFSEVNGYALAICAPGCASSADGSIILELGTGASHVSLFTTLGYSDNQWHYVVGTWDGTGANSGNIYVDGVNVKTGTMTNSAVSGSSLALGKEIVNDIYYYRGLMDDVRVYNRALSDTEVANLYGTNISRYAASNPLGSLDRGLLGHWTFDGKDMISNARDSSGNGNDGNLANFVSTTTVPGKIGQALQFDGFNDHVQLTETVSMDMPSGGAMTATAWVKTTDSFGSFFTLRSITNDFPMFSMCVGYNGGYTNAGHFIPIERCDAGNSCVVYFNTPTQRIDDGKWHFVAITLDQATDLFTAYVDLSSYSKASAADGAITFDTFLDLGSDQRGVYTGWGTVDQQYLSGSIDDARIYNRALSASELAQLYRTGAAKLGVTVSPNTAGTLGNGLVGHWTFDGPNMISNVKDSSGQGNNGFLVNQTPTTTTPGKIGQALKFDGVNDFISIPSTGAFTFSSGITVSAWIYPTKQIDFTRQGIFENGDGSLLLDVVSNTGQIHWGSTASSYVMNKWYHVVGVADTNGEKLYMNGSLIDSNGTSFSGVAQAALRIGLWDFGTYFGGKIDDVRVYNRALSASEVQQLYNMGR
ncbi:MAG: LamG domain-containing protein [Candidatus Paceibacterota bacterium]